MEEDLFVVIYSDGLPFAGVRFGAHLDIPASLSRLIQEGSNPQQIADALMAQALELEEGRPGDDISVVVVGVLKREDDPVRRMWVRLPLK